MTKKSTLSDLLTYAYNEAGMLDSDRIQRSIDGDPIVQSEYKEIAALVSVLDEAKTNASPESIRKILLHA